ncbi:MAG: hypothetical protein HYY01_08740 [Chloroflexi bacterium]|nr:hypothetical protein [Chloroflexota bacterium]
MNLAFFDLEGPLTPQDNAYELMGLWPGGRQVFEAISRYDDLLTLEGRPGYEPGDTLRLIVPFLLCHGVTTGAIQRMGEEATLVGGAERLLRNLQDQGWQVHAVTTSYAPFARAVAGRVGIPQSHVACTALPLERLDHWFPQEARRQTADLEAELAQRDSRDDGWLRERLDRFYWRDSVDSHMHQVLRVVRPMGGSRKQIAVEAYCLAQGQPLSRVVAVGDSITDAAMLRGVDQAGGLAIAFNANEYALPCATLGLASTHIEDLLPVLEAWQGGGRPAIMTWLEALTPTPAQGERGHFQWLAGRPPPASVSALHKDLRRHVRQAAAALG